MTSSDDALRAAVESALRNVEGLEASADEIERNWPRTSENTTLVAWKRRDAADLRLILSALTAPPVTEEMVERAARELFIRDAKQWADESDDIAEWWDTTDSRAKWLCDARAVLAAAGGGK